MNFGRVLDALLRGAAPPRRRAAPRRASGGAGAFGLTQTQTRQIGRALGTLAAAAAEAMKGQGGKPVPAPSPAPAKPRSRATAKAEAPAPARRLPQTAPPAATPPPPAPEEARVETAEARLMLRAMIAASKADGVVDREERGAVLEQLNTAGLSDLERDAVLADFDRPATPEELGRAVRDPMLAAQVYASAFFAAGELTEPERAWLDRLGVALKLDAAARQAIEARLQRM